MVQQYILDAYSSARDIALEAYRDYPAQVANEADIPATPQALKFGRPLRDYLKQNGYCNDRPTPWKAA